MAGRALDHDLPTVPGLNVLGTLGEGGSAVVYLARQEELDRLVAVKVIRRDIDEPKLWHDFQREAQAIARLSGHPNVVAVYTTGRTDAGHPFLVSEYLDRGSLASILDSLGPLEPLEVVRIGVAVANALIAAHDVGILHRDVKPGNVLLDRRGAVKLADFGIARLVAHHAFTTTGTLTFTPEHVAPEALRGVPEGPGTDVYGLASTLYTALTAESPFRRRADESIEAMLFRKLTTPPPGVPAGVPAGLGATLRAAMDPDPLQRPTLGAVRTALLEAMRELGPQPVAAAKTTEMPVAQAFPTRTAALDEVPLPAPRRRWPLLTAAALALALVATAGVVAFTQIGEEASESTGPEPAPTTSLVIDTDPSPPAVPSTTAPATSATTVAATAPPTTPAPATTAAPAATDAPTTTAAPATTGQVTTTTATPTTFPQTAPPEIVAEEAENFVRSYYATVAARDYPTGWSMLSPGYQAEGPGSFSGYTSFWDDVDSVEVIDVDVQAPGSDPARTLAQLTMRYVIDGVVHDEVDEVSLVRGPDGAPLIDSYQVVG